MPIKVGISNGTRTQVLEGLNQGDRGASCPIVMKEALKQSIDNLRTNKLRSCLTMFGIMWGVISIVILSAMGEGFQRGNQAVLEELGKNIVVIRNGRTSVQAGGERAGRVIRLNINDVHELRDKSRLIQHLSPELMRGGVSIKSAYNAASLQISGIWPEFQSIRTIEVSHGRLINEADNDEARRVVVIGREAVDAAVRRPRSRSASRSS